MVKRCDSVDALRYAYDEMMRIKEENQMLEKNKDYVEFTLQYTTVERTRDKDYRQVCFNGYSDYDFPGVPIMDVVCNEFDHKVVVVSKRDFEKLQTENKELKQKLHGFDPTPEFKELLKNLYSIEDVEKLEWFLNHVCGGLGSATGWRSIATFWKNRYNDLFKLIGFSSVEEIRDYLTNEAECDTLHEDISKLKDQVKYTCDEWYSANSSNNSWKAAAECNTPKELIEKLNLLRDDISGRSTVIESYKRDIEKWQKATGYLRPEDISAESMISKSMANEITTANEELWSENEKCEKRIEALLSEIREWKTATGCDTPEDISKIEPETVDHADIVQLITDRNLYKTFYEQLDQKVKILNGALQEWREGTGCPGPIAAKALIESGMAYEYAYHEAQKENRKLTEEVDSWKNVTGYSTPEDYMHARISGAFHTPFDYTAAWQKATGCDTPDQVKSHIEGLENAIRLTNKNMLSELDSEIEEWQKATGCNTPEQAKERIKALNERIDESEADYNHLLCTTGFESEGEIEDALDKCDHSTLRKALVDYEFDYEELLKLTGYKSNQDIRVALNYSEQFVYETMRELINSLKRQAKYTNLNWQNSTGFITPEKCGEYIKKLEDKLHRINGISEEA